MSTRLKRFQLWLNKNYVGLRSWIGVLFGIVILIVLFANIQENRKQNTAHLDEVESVIKEVRKGVDDVNENAKKQTIILCTIILRDGLDLEKEEARNIEEICEQEVRRFDAATAERTGEQNTNSSSVTPPPPSDTSQSSPQTNTGGGGTSPEEPDDPPQSILPIVNSPIIGCALGICL